MEFTAFASGSAGNLYRVSGDGVPALLLEAGLSFPRIRKELSFKVSELAGCLVSHEHGDHAKAARDLLKAGVDVYMTRGTADALGVVGHRVKIIEGRKQFQVGPWTVLPFQTEHDAAEPVGFVIVGAGGKLLYLSDSYYSRYRFDGITHFAIEINHSMEILDRNVSDGTVAHALRNRIRRSHMSLETALGLLEANDLSQVREIHLLHLSSSNSDAERFRLEVRSLTGKPTYIA